MTDDEDTVWIGHPQKARCYHTDPDCQHFPSERYAREISLDLALSYYELPECAYCANEWQPDDTDGWGIYEHAVKADPEELEP